MIYLDHAATSPLDPRVLEAMTPYLRGSFGTAADGKPERRSIWQESRSPRFLTASRSR